MSEQIQPQRTIHQDVKKINETSSMQRFVINRRQTVEDVLSQLNLESKYFAVLVNGKRVDLETELDQTDEILILPKIAGG